MPMYEFQCSKGHVTEDLVSIGTECVMCEKCSAPEGAGFVRFAKRILSPTPTTFVFADTTRRKKSFV